MAWSKIVGTLWKEGEIRLVVDKVILRWNKWNLKPKKFQSWWAKNDIPFHKILAFRQLKEHNYQWNGQLIKWK